MLRSPFGAAILIPLLWAQCCLAAETSPAPDGAAMLGAAALAGAVAAVVVMHLRSQRKSPPIDPARAWSVLGD
jgi:hypothetical protein